MNAKKMQLAIVGLGYAGLPLALEFAKKSFKRKDKWRVVDYNSENYDKYWY